MADEKNENLFSRLTKLFRSGPTVRRKIKNYKEPSASSAHELFRRNVSDVYASTVSAYGAFDRMSRYSDFCLSGDTLVAVNHPDVQKTIKEIVDDYQNGIIDYGVFSYDNGEVKFGDIENAWCTGKREIWEVTLDNGDVIKCTDNHPFMLRNGEYKRTDQLSKDDALMPFKRGKIKGGYLFNTSSKRGLVYEHCLVKEKYDDYRFKKSDGFHVHHVNFSQQDNRDCNLVKMEAKEHLSYHAKINNKRFEILENREAQSGIMKSRWDLHGDLRQNFEKHLEKRKGSEGFKESVRKTIERNKSNPPGVGNANRKDQKGIWNARCKKEKIFQTIYSSYAPGMSIHELLEKLEAPTEKHLLTRLGWAGYSSWPDFVERYTNHKVVSVIKTDKFDLVYDITVRKYHNFALMSPNSSRSNIQGLVFVHNSEMESTPEIASALDIYAEESTSQDDKGKVLHIYSENRIVKDLLENLFYDVLNVDFNLPMWTRNLVKYGDFFLFNDISPQYGVINVYPIPISEMEREEGYDPKDPMAVRFRWITKGNSALENWQISHFRLLGNDAFLPYGSSVLESARRIWRQLILIEDAMLVYRIVRAPERRIFYIDVGSVPPEEVENYMQQAQTSLKRNKAVDRTSGKSDLRYNPLSIDDDYFIPVRGGESGTKIDSLPGGANAAAVEDVVYIQNKLFAALKVPKAYIGYDADIGSKATLAQEDIRFSRTIARIQKVIISELNKIAMIHLYSHGFTDEEMLEFSLALNNPSSVAQLQKLELIKTRFEIAGTAPEGSVDREWIRKNILNLTDEEILRIKGGRKADKIEDAEVEAAKPEEPAADEPAADEPADEPAAEEPAADEEGDAESEDLFAGDFKDGTVIGEVDGDLPVKPKLEAQDAFGNRLKRKRRRFSNADAEVPDFLSMTIDKHPQSTTNEPFGHSMTRSMKNEDDVGTSLYDSLLGEVNSTKPRRTPEITSTLRRLGITINRNNKNGDVLKETSAMLNSTEQKDDSNET